MIEIGKPKKAAYTLSMSDVLMRLVEHISYDGSPWWEHVPSTTKDKMIEGVYDNMCEYARNQLTELIGNYLRDSHSSKLCDYCNTPMADETGNPIS